MPSYGFINTEVQPAMELAQALRASAVAVPAEFRRRLHLLANAVEVLEERSLLSLSLIKDINPVPLFPAQITGAGANVYFVTKAADGGADLDVKNATGTAVVEISPGRTARFPI